MHSYEVELHRQLHPKQNYQSRLPLLLRRLRAERQIKCFETSVMSSQRLFSPDMTFIPSKNIQTHITTNLSV
jgi:hypothetical protein